MPFRNYSITKGGELTIGQVLSPNFTAGLSGWIIRKDGSAEFNDITIRGGTIEGGTALYYNGTPAAGNLVASISAGPGTDSFGNAYLGGFTSYTISPVTAISTLNGQIGWWTAATQAGPYTPTILLFADASPANTLQLNGSFSVGADYIIYEPSGDATGATDATNINLLLFLGTEVRLVPGTYYVDATLEIPGNGVLRGAGRSGVSTFGQTIIEATSSVHAVIASTGWLAASNTAVVAPTTISDLKVYGNGNATHGIVLQSWDSLVSDVYVQDISGDGIRFDSQSQSASVTISSGSGVNNRVRNCTVDVCGRGIATNDVHGIFTDGYCTDNVVASVSGAAAIAIGFAVGWKVSGCHVYGLAQNGIQLGQMLMTRVTGNYVETWGGSASASTYRGIDAFTGGQSDEGSGSVIAGNTLVILVAPGNASTSLEGISFKGDNSNTSSVAITGNVMRCAPATGFTHSYAIALYGAGASAVLDVTSTGNNPTGNWTTNVFQSAGGGTINLSTGV